MVEVAMGGSRGGGDGGGGKQWRHRLGSRTEITDDEGTDGEETMSVMVELRTE
jgi:hypothetical protein